MPKYWYLATPYTKYPLGVEEAFRESCRQAALLLQKNVMVFCPIAHSHPIALHGNMDTLDLVLWLTADRPLMEGAHGLIVCMLPTWEISSGIKAEMEYFSQAHKPIVMMKPSIVPPILLLNP